MLDKNTLENADAFYKAALDIVQGQVVCPRCGHKQPKQRRNNCQNCLHTVSITNGEFRIDWNSVPKKLYSGMQEILPELEKSQPLLSLKASRSSYDWKISMRNATIGTLISFMAFFGFRYTYRLLVGPVAWKKMQSVSAQVLPKPIVPATKFFFN